MKITLLTAVLLLSFTSFTQTLPELIFKNPVLISGTARQDGARYRFSNVTSGSNGLDAIVEIRGRSANDVILSSIDSAGLGWDKAFQPALGIPNVGANREWWMEFRMEFVKAGTSAGIKIDTFYVTGLDIDGDGSNLSEWAEMKRTKTISLSPLSSLTTSLLASVNDLTNDNNDGTDYKINGPVANYSSIDTGGSSVMATYKYAKKDRIDFKIGGRTSVNGGTSATGGIRLNSLWFKQFSLAPNVILPVNLVDFSAILNKANVDLKWITATEKNVSHFQLEKSLDGANYSAAGVVFAYGNTTENKTYAFSDNVSNVQKGVIYYRLRSIDIDGKSQLSEIRIIRISKGNEGLSILAYPNPAASQVNVTVPSAWQGKEVVITVFNQNGQIVKTSKSGNSSQTEIIAISDLAKGFYLIKATCGTETAQQKIVKN